MFAERRRAAIGPPAGWAGGRIWLAARARCCLITAVIRRLCCDIRTTPLVRSGHVIDARDGVFLGFFEFFFLMGFGWVAFFRVVWGLGKWNGINLINFYRIFLKSFFYWWKFWWIEIFWLFENGDVVFCVYIRCWNAISIVTWFMCFFIII